MKLRGDGVAAFVRKPPAGLRFALAYGSDLGLIAECADLLVRSVVDDPRDPFRVTDLTGAIIDADAARLTDELSAMSLIGGRRVVRLRGASAKHADQLEAAMQAPGGDTLLVVEAPDVTSSKLKIVALFEKGGNSVAISCFADSDDTLAGTITATLSQAGLRAGRDVIEFLVSRLGGDRMLTRRELEKLILYVGDQSKEVTLADCEACIGNTSDLHLDDVAFAAADGDLKELELGLTRLFRAGTESIATLRAVQRHFQKLQLAASGGRPFGIHFSRTAQFTAQTRTWNGPRLNRALELLTDAEIDCKTTGMPAEAVCRHTLLKIALAARPARR
jgi:DNA polymerase-3 subunit delta